VRRLALVLLAAVVVAAAVLALGFVVFGTGSEVPGGVETFTLVDERTGSYRGVAMGDSIEEVRHVLGQAAGGSGFAPAGMLPTDTGVPQSIPAPGRLQPALLKYEDVALLVGPRGVYAFIVTEDGAQTARGVAIGDELDRAREVYDLRCIDVAAGESPFGGVSTYPSCSTTIAGRVRIWFGKDPITSITLMSLRHARA
jgi:hypothetical protein